MAANNVTRLKHALETDGALHQEFYATKTPAEAAAVATAAGFAVTVEELTAWARGQGELDDRELDKVAGGFGPRDAAKRILGGGTVPPPPPLPDTGGVLNAVASEASSSASSSGSGSSSSGSSSSGGSLPWPPPAPPKPPGF